MHQAGPGKQGDWTIPQLGLARQMLIGQPCRSWMARLADQGLLAGLRNSYALRGITSIAIVSNQRCPCYCGPWPKAFGRRVGTIPR